MNIIWTLDAEIDRNNIMVYEVDQTIDTIWNLALVHGARQWPPLPQ